MAGKFKFSKRIQKLRAEAKKCWYCDRPLTRGVESCPSACTVDHIIPRNNGGRGIQENLIICCFTCNQLKAFLMPEEFIQKVHEMIKFKSYQNYTEPQLWHMINQIHRLMADRPYLKLYSLLNTDKNKIMAQQEINWNYETAKEFIVFWGHDPSLVHSVALSAFKKHKQQPLFITNDGIEIFNGDFFYSLDKSGIFRHMAIPGGPQYEFTFSTVTAAGEFNIESKKFAPHKQTFQQVVDPVIKWLAENHNPHTKVFIDNSSAELLNGIEGFGNDKYIKD